MRMVASFEAHGKVECDLLALLFRRSIETGLLVGAELISQGSSGDIGNEAGEQPGEKCRQSHGCGVVKDVVACWTGRLVQDKLSPKWMVLEHM